MNEIFLMNALESFHNFDNNSNSLPKWKYFSWHFGLISEKISLLAVLHNDDDEIRGWMNGDILVNSY